MTYLDEVVALLERSRAHLRDAIWSHGQGRHRMAVSVAYYAVFCAAKAVLAYHRDGAKTHKGVAKQFLQIAVLNSDFPSPVGYSIGAMLRQRLAADYDLSKPVDDWTEEEASLAIEGATAFVDEVEAWLLRNLQPGERLDTTRDSHAKAKGPYLPTPVPMISKTGEALRGAVDPGEMAGEA